MHRKGLHSDRHNSDMLIREGRPRDVLLSYALLSYVRSS